MISRSLAFYSLQVVLIVYNLFEFCDVRISRAHVSLYGNTCF